MNDALNGRCEYRPRGRDPDENLGLLAEAIAKSAHLFNQGGRLVWIHARELRSVDTGILRELTKTTSARSLRLIDLAAKA